MRMRTMPVSTLRIEMPLRLLYSSAISWHLQLQDQPLWSDQLYENHTSPACLHMLYLHGQDASCQGSQSVKGKPSKNELLQLHADSVQRELTSQCTPQTLHCLMQLHVCPAARPHLPSPDLPAIASISAGTIHEEHTCIDEPSHFLMSRISTGRQWPFPHSTQ